MSLSPRNQAIADAVMGGKPSESVLEGAPFIINLDQLDRLMDAARAEGIAMAEAPLEPSLVPVGRPLVLDHAISPAGLAARLDALRHRLPSNVSDAVADEMADISCEIDKLLRADENWPPKPPKTLSDFDLKAERRAYGGGPAVYGGDLYPAVNAPPPPWPPGATTNAKREGWNGYFAGVGRHQVYFPADRLDLRKDYEEGWDAAKAAHEAEDVGPEPEPEVHPATPILNAADAHRLIRFMAHVFANTGSDIDLPILVQGHEDKILAAFQQSTDGTLLLDGLTAATELLAEQPL